MTVGGDVGSLALPAPTYDLDRAKRDFEEAGVAIVADGLVGERLRYVRDVVDDLVDQDHRMGWVERYAFDTSDVNHRIWNLPSRHPVFCELAIDPRVLAFVREYLGWPATLSSLSANIQRAGGDRMFLHADQEYMPLPWSGRQAINVLWCIDDFTEANGGTGVVPGSHALTRPPTTDERASVVPRPIEAPAGSLVLIDGRTWHGTGAAEPGAPRRAGVFGWYTLPIFLPQENWMLTLNPIIRQRGPAELLELMGFTVAGSMGRSIGRASFL